MRPPVLVADGSGSVRVTWTPARQAVVVRLERLGADGTWAAVAGAAPVEVAPGAEASVTWQVRPGRYRAVLRAVGAPAGEAIAGDGITVPGRGDR